MRYNNSFFNENAIKHSAWNWWDYVLTGVTGGLYAAGKGVSDAVNYAVGKEEKEKKIKQLTDDYAAKFEREGLSPEEAKEKAKEITKGLSEANTKEEWDDELAKLSGWYKDDTKNAVPEQGTPDEVSGERERLTGEQKATEEGAKEATETAKQTELASGELAETEAQQNATTSAIQAQNAGLNKERAGMMGEANLANRSNANNALAGIAASTQADYLNKIGQANALQQQAENMQKGAGLNTAGATVSGAAQGFVNGASMFGTSDENEKTGCSDLDFIKNYYGNKKNMTSQILEQAQKMFELKAQLDKLKENK